MAKLTPFAGAILVVGVLWSGAGHAAGDDLAALKAELEALKKDYNAHIQALEARIKQLESAASTAAAAPATAAPAAAAAAAAPAPAFPEPAPVAAAAPNKGSNATAFNPAISMILTGNYASLSQDPATYRIAGFMPPPEGEGPGERSFNLGESELTVAANVDPYFFANVTAAIQPDNSIDIEEAYFKTLALSHGFTLKGGRFFSGTGYLNEIHSHNWDFVDQPLVYQAFFAGQLAQDGVQLRWIAPTDYFIELGAEAGSGRSFPGTQRDSNALGSDALFAHVGGDVGDSTSWRMGVSWLRSKSTDRAYEDVDQFGNPVDQRLHRHVAHLDRGCHDEVGAARGPDAAPAEAAGRVHAPHRERPARLRRHGRESHAAATAARSPAGTCRRVYEFKQRWRAGLRYDSMHSGTPSIGLVSTGVLPFTAFPALLPASPERTTFMIDWSLSRVLAPARAVRLGRGACRTRTRPAAAAAIHLFHRRPRRA